MRIFKDREGDLWQEGIEPGDMIIGAGNGYVHEECALKEEK